MFGMQNSRATKQLRNLPAPAAPRGTRSRRRWKENCPRNALASRRTNLAAWQIPIVGIATWKNSAPFSRRTGGRDDLSLVGHLGVCGEKGASCRDGPQDYERPRLVPMDAFIADWKRENPMVKTWGLKAVRVPIRKEN